MKRPLPFAMYFLAVDPVANAQAAFDAGRFTEARVHLEAIARKDARASALLARIYNQLKLPQLAVASARQAQSLGPTIPAVQHTLALYYAQSNQRKLAALWEGRFAKSKEADPAAAHRAALLYAEVKDWPQAITFARLALTAKPDHPDPHRILAQAFEITGKQIDAIAEHRILLNLLPYDEPTHAEFGQALLRLERINEASAFLEEARTKFDKSPQIELALGVAQYAQRRFDDAGGHFLRVIKLTPDVPQPYIFLGKMIEQIPNRVPEIRNHAKAWLEKESKSGFAPFVYARTLIAASEPDDVTKPLLLEAIRRDPRVWDFPFELGQLLERQRDFDGAANAYQKAISLSPKAPEPHYRLARVWDRLKQPAKAEQQRALHKQLLQEPKSGMQ